MRTSQYLVSTLKETPASAEVVSHQLMLRGGFSQKRSFWLIHLAADRLKGIA